ncbi:hypothetical protein [Prochlorococcus sp. MIT 1341]|uniref:hypothetical protein n=1 Tax=Prochlorococcus sp. MIT 1341 TaxID=3096221 RepID=UPI002A760C3F|nr:hypothetical protein [Prochlorococcus sp. MIT 1341]
MEHEIKLALKRIEFITAVINDIEDEEIQAEYSSAFENIKNSLIILSVEYDNNGFTDVSENALTVYQKLLSQFENDFEL